MFQYRRLPPPQFSMDYFFCRTLIYLKIECQYFLNKYRECLETCEIHNLDINEETLESFNLIAYSLAHLGNFNKAHKIIDEIIKKAEIDYHKAKYLDSKEEFYQMEGKFREAIPLYKKSLNLEEEHPFSFQQETRKKLKECLKNINNENK